MVGTLFQNLNGTRKHVSGAVQTRGTDMEGGWQADAVVGAGKLIPGIEPVIGCLFVTGPGLQKPHVLSLQAELLVGRAMTSGPSLRPRHRWPAAVSTAPGEVDAGEVPFFGIADHTVSRRHACIRRCGAAYVVEDLHSVNGTCLGAERLAAGVARLLRNGDRISIGAAQFVMHYLAQPGKEQVQASRAGDQPDAVDTSVFENDPTPSHVIAQIVGSIDATRYAHLMNDDLMPDAGELMPVRQRKALLATSASIASGSSTRCRKTSTGTQMEKAGVSPTLYEATVCKLHAMAQVGIALGVVRDRTTLIEKLMKFMFDLFPLADRAFMLSCESAVDAPTPVAACRRDGRYLDPASIRLSRTILQAVLGEHRAILCADTLADLALRNQDSILAQPMRSIMCVPLLLEKECLGMIQVDTGSDPHAFGENDLELLTGVCAEAAVTLKTFLLYADIERLLDGFVCASVQAIEERDPVTAGHSSRVAEYAVRLAQAVDARVSGPLQAVFFSHEQVREIRYAALLHDFGKVGVREHVLCKEKKLHPDALAVLQERFHTARASNRARGYEALVEAHLADGIDGAGLRGQKVRLDDALDQENRRLDSFLEAVLLANEPRVSACRAGVGLDPVPDPAPSLVEIGEYRFASPACNASTAADRALLEPPELSALCLAQGCLTRDERRQIEAHVSDTHAFLVLIPWTRELAAVPSIAHAHHEKLDGSGYPLGLRGGQIGIQSRILTICDIFDALTATDRPYKKAVSLDSALSLMQEECQCGHLDGDLFDVFLQTRAWSPA